MTRPLYRSPILNRHRGTPDGLAETTRSSGVGDRVRWGEVDAAQWSGGAFDLVVRVSASHAFADLPATSAAVRRHLHPGGQVLLGDVFWETTPTREALAAPEAAASDVPDLSSLLAQVQAVAGRVRGVLGLATLVLHDIATPPSIGP